MKVKNSFLLGCLAMVGFAFMSCSHDDFNFSENASKQLESEYEANFIKKYGAINPNQTWDFATMEPTLSLPSSESTANARTRGASDNLSYSKGYMTVDKGVINYLLQNLPKGNNNTPKGRPFSMLTTGNSFTIVPVFQGCATYYWELWMSVDGLGDMRIWSKGDDFKFRKDGETTWSEPGVTKDGMQRGVGDLEVYAPTYTFANIGTKDLNMYFYLKVWKTAAGYTNGYDVYLKYLADPNNAAYQPYKATSLDKWMIDLENATKPTNIPADNEVTIIGCEDAISGSDKDFEDLVFMVYGKPVPPTKRVVEVIESTTKRYMMEDLGDTDDFDFNDVVVDVSTRKKITYIYPSLEATEWTSKTEEKMPDQAIVRAAGGTLDFTLTIGNTNWTKSDHFNKTLMLNTGLGGAINEGAELAKFEVSGWSPNNNNVSVSVESNGSNNNVYVIKFPKKGTAPKIIAVNPTTTWMTERTEVPTSWFIDNTNE